MRIRGKLMEIKNIQEFLIDQTCSLTICGNDGEGKSKIISSSWLEQLVGWEYHSLKHLQV